MKTIKMYQVDAFTNKLFAGNPAAVCILENWLDDGVMQKIAAENNLAETAFVVNKSDKFEIRWFTPTVEVDLCGHATLASAYVIFNIMAYDKPEVRFFSPKSGILNVSKSDNYLFLDFPTDRVEKWTKPVNIEKCIGVPVLEVYKGKSDFVAVIESEEAVRNLIPDLGAIFALDARGLIVTAKGKDIDFVSRFFGPQCGIDEDPVTGSAHTTLIPIWSEKLDKNKMIARQLSKRGGELICEYKGDRCLIGGQAKLYMSGEIYID